MIKIMQKKTICPVFILIICFLIFISMGAKNSFAKKERGDAALTSAFSFFVNLKEHNFKKLWRLLTLSSRQYIVGSIENSLIKNNVKIGKNRIYKNMSDGGYIAKAYWDGFLKTFKTSMVLKYSVWKIKSIGSKKAQIEIDYKYAKGPTFLKIYKQKGKWRFGLIESLYGRMLMGKIAHKVLNKF